MPLQATSGAASYDAFGGGVAAVPNYIEDVFSTYLWTTAQPTTIVNGIDLATKGGMVWTKLRNSADNNRIWDSARGPTKRLITDSTAAQVDEGIYGAVFNTNGFTDRWFGSGYNATSWTFRKQPKFFDVVTYTGNDTAGRTIAHNLGSVPGCIIVKATNSTLNWFVYHRSLGNTKSINLNLTSAATTVDNWGNTTPTSTVFTVDSGSETNQSGVTYVAYLFAHNAGGFGLTGTDNVISCGSYTGTGAVGNKITLGYEPQWLLIKRTDTANSWYLFDTMRGLSLTQSLALLPNGTNSDLDYGSSFQLNADGVTQNNANSAFNASGGTYIYIAIRRGPMKVPTSGTSVFKPVTRTGTGTSAYSVTGAGFSPDSIFIRSRNNASGRNWNNFDRLRGIQNDLVFGLTNAETNNSDKVSSYDMGGYSVPATPSATLNASGENFIDYLWKRAPSFMDVVCYNRTSGATVTHNLGVTPELLIVKRRGGVEPWGVMRPNTTGYLLLNAADALSTGLSATATSTTFTLGTGAFDYSDNYVAYLFATLAGVSKVGSYTGNGSSQTINCGFTGGARFVLIKRTDTAGDWYVWDTARGIVAGNDPYLGLNTYVNEVTTNDTIDPDSTGFIVNQVAATNVNVTSATYIFLAIA